MFAEYNKTPKNHQVNKSWLIAVVILAAERRAIERALFSGRLLGVVATNALELGIDVGAMDVCLIAGYPGTIASTWQQAGRVGRRERPSLVILLPCQPT